MSHGVERISKKEDVYMMKPMKNTKENEKIKCEICRSKREEYMCVE